MTASHQHHRGRRTLLWAGVCFCLAQLGTGLLLDHAWTSVRFPRLVETLQTLQRHPRSPDILCVGSSRLGAAFRENVIEETLREHDSEIEVTAFNAAIEGADLATMDHVLAHIFEQGTRPGVVVVEVTPEIVAERNRWLKHNVTRLMTWQETPAYVVEAIEAGGFRELFLTRLLPLYAFREGIRRESGTLLHSAALAPPPDRRAKRQTKDGAQTSTVNWEEYMRRWSKDSAPPLVRSESGMGVFRDFMKGYRVGGKPAQTLEQLIARCQAHGADVILVAVPTAPIHRQLYTPEADAMFLGHMEHVTRSYYCRFVDYRASVPEKLFQDSHHVNQAGAVDFSRRFAREVLVPQRRGPIAGLD